MSVELYNKLKAAGNLSPTELEELREKLGISVYAELEAFLLNPDLEDLFDYVTIISNAIQMNTGGTNIALDYSDHEQLEQFVSDFGIYDLNPNRLRTILVKLPLRPQRAKKEKIEAISPPVPVVEQTPLHTNEEEVPVTPEADPIPPTVAPTIPDNIPF